MNRRGFFKGLFGAGAAVGAAAALKVLPKVEEPVPAAPTLSKWLQSPEAAGMLAGPWGSSVDGVVEDPPVYLSSGAYVEDFGEDDGEDDGLSVYEPTQWLSTQTFVNMPYSTSLSMRSFAARVYSTYSGD